MENVPMLIIPEWLKHYNNCQHVFKEEKLQSTTCWCACNKSLS